MNEIYRKRVSNQAEKFLRKQTAHIQKRIVAAIKGLPMEGEIERLKGTKYYRLRVGKIRIVYEINHQDKLILINTIDNRGDIY